MDASTTERRAKEFEDLAGRIRSGKIRVTGHDAVFRDGLRKITIVCPDGNATQINIVKEAEYYRVRAAKAEGLLAAIKRNIDEMDPPPGEDE